MASTPVVSAAHRVTEQRILELLEQSRIDRPDEIQYGHGCLRLLWHSGRSRSSSTSTRGCRHERRGDRPAGGMQRALRAAIVPRTCRWAGVA